MKMMTYADYQKLARKDPYYENRWDYFKAVIEILQKESFTSVLELGPYGRPIVDGADTMDRKRNFPGLTYLHNALDFPWPVKDKKYDLFIALQVWEHLKGKQKQAFREVKRIAKMALLSFPQNWDCPGNCHHHITEKKIAAWTLNIRPVKKVKVGRRLDVWFGGPCRAIYLFKFD